MPETIRLLLYGLLLVSVFAGGNAPAWTQGRDQGARIDRLDRLRDRAHPRLQDRARERIITDRPVIRDDPAVVDRETDALPASASDQPVRAIIINEEGHRVRRGEILALNLSDTARAAAEAAGLTVTREKALSSGQILTRLTGSQFDLPSGMINLLRTADPEGVFTPNHIYEASGEPAVAVTTESAVWKKSGPSATVHSVGMIDGQPDPDHPALSGILAETRHFGDGPANLSEHGTAVALRLRNTSSTYLTAARLEVYVANVLAGDELATATAESLAEALTWQEGNRVEVLNISLAGPPNDIVEIFIRQYLNRGGRIVAAVGNGGPLSTDVYPAAYEGVTGVTAVDPSGKVLPMATRGEHVDLAAPGAGITISGMDVARTWSGTSYAAPYAAIWLLAADRYGLELSESCEDAGPPGWDSTYGCGLINLDHLPVLQLASKSK